MNKTWLSTYKEYTEKHEAPSLFHLWVGIATIAAAMERKTYSRLASEVIYPNMFVILVGPSGKVRKGGALGMGTKLLKELERQGLVNLSAKRTTVAAMIKKMAKLDNTYELNGKLVRHSSLTAICPELDTIMSQGKIELMRILTDLYDTDAHEGKFENEKANEKEEIYNLWFHLLGATTPIFFTGKDVEESIGQGFTSRCFFIFQDKPRFRSKLYVEPDGKQDIDGKQKKCFNELSNGLLEINRLVGEFTWDKAAGKWMNDWYESLPEEPETASKHLVPYYTRKHMHMLKLAMALSASEMRGDMVLRKHHFQQALGILDETEKTMVKAFEGVGRLDNADGVRAVSEMIKARGKKGCTLSRIITETCLSMSLMEVNEALNKLKLMGKVRQVENKLNGRCFLWVENKSTQ